MSVAWLGDSITRGSYSPPGSNTPPGQLAAMMSEAVGNFGLDGGDLIRIREQVWRVQVDGHRWGTVVILAGTNDVAAGASAEQVWQLQRDFVKAVRASGNVRVVLCALTPMAGWPSATPEMVAVAADVRAMGQAWAKPNGVTWVDTYGPLANERGEVRDGLSVDGLHLTASGSAVLASAVWAALRGP